MTPSKSLIKSSSQYVREYNLRLAYQSLNCAKEWNGMHRTDKFAEQGIELAKSIEATRPEFEQQDVTDDPEFETIMR